MSPLDKRGIFSYLAITFIITYAIEGLMILKGFRAYGIPAFAGQLVIAAVMWVPALAAIITTKFVTCEGLSVTSLRIGSLKPYFQAALLIPLCFLIIYGLTWLLGIGHPDWELLSLRKTIADAGGPTEMPFPPQILLLIFLTASLIPAPFMNGLFGFGEELGWRGYLLPKLMPLGKPKAYLLLGAIWGLWHAPLIAVGFNYPGYPVWGILGMMALTTALSIYINELTLFYRSSILAGWIHGVMNAQGYGIWRVLFPDVNPLLGGFTGILGIAVFAALGFWQMNRLKKASGLSTSVKVELPSIATVHS